MNSTLKTASVSWPTLREMIDIERVATELLGPSPGRGGGRGLWWRCPFHDDRNPSFQVNPAKRSWRCFGCGAHGDAAALVMKIDHIGFRDAVAFLAGGSQVAGSRGKTPGIVRNGNVPTRRAKPSSEWCEKVLGIIEEAESTLWSDPGVEARAYLHGRGLTDATIQCARLGLILDGHPTGVSIPWFNDTGRPTLLNVRHLDGGEPKYQSIKGSRRGGLYPGRGAILTRRPAIVVEGEFDALLLGQELDGLAGVVTTGSASSRLDDPDSLLPATAWYAATDADDAGDRAAEAMMKLGRFRRVRPPGVFNDWTEAHAEGVNLRRWWLDIFKGVQNPALFGWDELKKQRWGPGVDDTDDGIDAVAGDVPDVCSRADQVDAA
ncbi:MAG: hypothetical protein KGM43_01490 [Planctomycetota bacterium]|nr:hypothetical protein [Planctomycetota bacterium]